MNFLINVNFDETHSLDIVLIDPDPEEQTAVYSALFDKGSDQELPIFFEAPHDAEVWDILHCAVEAFKDFKINPES
jgi:hypothetical protein